MKDVFIKVGSYCFGNPGTAGFHIELRTSDNYTKTIEGGYFLTTENRIAVLAINTALQKLKYSCRVHIQTTSVYILYCIEKRWLDAQENIPKKDLLTMSNLNVDLWQELYHLVKLHTVSIDQMKHNSDIFRVQERAKIAALSDTLLPDIVYEDLERRTPNLII